MPSTGDRRCEGQESSRDNADNEFINICKELTKTTATTRITMSKIFTPKILDGGILQDPLEFMQRICFLPMPGCTPGRFAYESYNTWDSFEQNFQSFNPPNNGGDALHPRAVVVFFNDKLGPHYITFSPMKTDLIFKNGNSECWLNAATLATMACFKDPEDFDSRILYHYDCLADPFRTAHIHSRWRGGSAAKTLKRIASKAKMFRVIGTYKHSDA